MKKPACIFFSFLLSFPSLAQVNDFESWYGFEVSTKIFKKSKLFIEDEIRLFDNATRVSQHHIEIGIDYRFNKEIKVDLAYRFIHENSLENYFQREHRFSADGRYQYKLDRWYLTYRGRLQMLISGYHTSRTGKTPVQILRNKFSIEYNIPKIKGFPSAGFEHFYYHNQYVQVDKISFFAGFQYKLSKHWDIELSYSYRKQVRSGIPVNRYILAFEASYDL